MTAYWLPNFVLFSFYGFPITRGHKLPRVDNNQTLETFDYLKRSELEVCADGMSNESAFPKETLFTIFAFESGFHLVHHGDMLFQKI
jgi:hypothetical protein